MHDPDNKDLFEYGFYTNQDIYEKVLKQLPRLSSTYTHYQFSLLLNKHKQHFGVQQAKKNNKLATRGRYLYMLKEAVHGKRS
jgi:hypothetical protein